MTGAVRRKPRAYHPDRVRDALLAQVELLRSAVQQLTTERQLELAGLLGHLARQIDALPKLLAEPAPRAARPQVDVTDWVAATVHEERDTADAAVISAAALEMEAVVDMGVREDVLIPHHLGAMRAVDFTVTRIVELTLHSDDLTRATGRPVRLDRGALAITTRVLTDALAARAPGSSTEVRIPPFAAVQCLAGPRHTRGTPPNVVETDPVTWLRLATGRVGWAAALESGRLRAGGERAGALAEQLPVLG
ncbi:sterol carrier family protein [Streptomyces mayteni]